MKLLQYVNNNHNDEYYIDGKKVINITSAYIRGTSDDSKTVDVTREQKRVYYGEEEVGGPYPATSYHFYAELYLFGTHFPVDLNNLITRGVDVFAVEYTLED